MAGETGYLSREKSGRWLLLALVVVGVAACQTTGRSTGPEPVPVISVEEAKKVTASIKGRTFVAPPRSIDDLRERLGSDAEPAEECYVEDPDIDEVLEARLKKLPRFPKYPSGVHVLENKASEEFRKGNVPRAIDLINKAIDRIPQRMTSGLSARYAMRARYQALIGDFEAADKSFADMRRLSTNSSGVNNFHRFYHARAEAAVSTSRGDLQAANRHLWSALELSAERDTMNPIHRLQVLLDLAQNLMLQGRLVEAEIQSREAFNSLSYYHDTYTGRLATLISRILYEQGRYEDARHLAAVAVRIIKEECVAPGAPPLAFARHALARALARLGQWQESIDQFERIRAGLADAPEVFELRFGGDPDWAMALLHSGRPDAAYRILEQSYERLRDRLGDKHYRSAESLGFLAAIDVKRGNLKAAHGAFQRTVPILLARSRQANDDLVTLSSQDARRTFILESYLRLLILIDRSGDAERFNIDTVETAFRISQSARGRSVQRALATSGARAAVADPALADLVRREQDAQKQIAAAYGLLANAVSQHRLDGKLIGDLRVKIDRLRSARGALMSEIEAGFPEYADLINPKPLSIAEARRQLHPGEVLVTTFTGNDGTYVWAVPKSGPAAFVAADLGREDLEEQIAFLRAALEPDAQTLGDIPPFDVAQAHDLYARLLAPVSKQLTGAGSLLIVADGPLGYVPFSLLVTEPASLPDGSEPLFAEYREIPWLIRDHAVTVLPSVTSLRTLRSAPPAVSTGKAFAGFGDPWFSREQAAAGTGGPVQTTASGAEVAVRGVPIRVRAAPATAAMASADLAALPRLPDTAEEIKSMAAALGADPDADVRIGRDASEAAVKAADLSNVRVVAFATHGLVPGDLDGLSQPALALSSPAVVGDGEDGLLTMGEILKLRLNADWVVLSACNTAASDGAGAEAVSGLGRAFFYAGTRALLATNWPVETSSARALTTELFRRQSAEPGLSRAEAHRQAMLHLIDQGLAKDEQGRAVFSYGHPLFWAPFSLIGDGGGARPGS